MPRSFLQSLRTKDDNKSYVKVPLGRFFIKILLRARNNSGLACNVEYSWTGGNFFTLWKTLPNANDTLYQKHPVFRNIPRLLLHQLQYKSAIFIYIKNGTKLDDVSRSSSIHISWHYAIYIYNYLPGVTHQNLFPPLMNIMTTFYYF